MKPKTLPLLPHGGYKKLRGYRVAAALYDATIVFCKRFYSRDHRMRDQMIQAARSGVRNISEASGAAATSSKAEIKLTNVAHASLRDELPLDYESFLKQRKLPIWSKDSQNAKAMRERLRYDHVVKLKASPKEELQLKGLSDLARFVSKVGPEIAGNAMLCAINQAQATYLLRRQIDSLAKKFLTNGGFTESLYRNRIKSRKKFSSS